jgi:hypothetical protein
MTQFLTADSAEATGLKVGYTCRWYSATANTGAGGNGGKTNASTALAGGNGGSGLVVLRYVV